MKYAKIHETHVYLLQSKTFNIVFSMTSDSGEWDWTAIGNDNELLGHRVIRWVDDDTPEAK